MAAVAMLALAWAAWRRFHAAPAEAWETVPVERGDVVARVTATGTLSALKTVQVGSQVSGRIAELDADFNDEVHKGERIAKIDPQLFEAALEQARANDLAAQANVEKAVAQAEDAERAAERARALAQRELVAVADVQTAEANASAAKAAVKAARAAREQARAALHQAEVNLGYTDIRSPIDGVVISRNVDVGQTVAASFQAPTIFVIAEDLRQMQVDTSVAESDIGRLVKDMKATFTVDAWPGRRFEGKVRQIRNAPQTVQNVVTYDAVVDVANDDLALKPGMTATVTFVYAERDGVLKVPNLAFRFRPDDAAPAPKPTDPTHRTLYALRDGQPVAVEVVAGVTDGSATEIVSGDLKEGDAVVTDRASGARASGAPSGGGGGRDPFRRVF